MMKWLKKIPINIKNFIILIVSTTLIILIFKSENEKNIYFSTPRETKIPVEIEKDCYLYQETKEANCKLQPNDEAALIAICKNEKIKFLNSKIYKTNDVKNFEQFCSFKTKYSAHKNKNDNSFNSFFITSKSEKFIDNLYTTPAAYIVNNSLITGENCERVSEIALECNSKLSKNCENYKIKFNTDNGFRCGHPPAVY